MHRKAAKIAGFHASKTKERRRIAQVYAFVGFAVRSAHTCTRSLLGIKRLLVETGITFNTFLLENSYINEFYHFYSNNVECVWNKNASEWVSTMQFGAVGLDSAPEMLPPRDLRRTEILT